MIIRVIDKGATFSIIEYPNFSGLLSAGVEYKYGWANKKSNQFDFIVNIRYTLIEVGGQNIFDVLKSESKFEVSLIDEITLLQIYQVVRQATHHIASYLFNNAGFMGDIHRIIPDTTLEELKPDLGYFLAEFNR